MRWRWSACRCAASLRMTRDARDARYSLLRGYFHGADDDTADELEQERLLSVTLPDAARLHRRRRWATWRCTRWASAWCRCGVRRARRGRGGLAGSGRERHAGAVGPARCADIGRGQVAGHRLMSSCDAVLDTNVPATMSPSDYIRSHIRTVPDWPAPGVQFRDITPLLSNPRVFRVLIDQFVHRYFDTRARAPSPGWMRAASSSARCWLTN